MARWRKGSRWLLVCTVALALLTTACGDSDDATDDPTLGPDGAQSEGRIAGTFDLKGATVTVGSKEFTEQLILGHLTKLALETAGADVKEEIGLQGSTIVRDALKAGRIDLYWEYLGTGWVTHLGNDKGIPGAEAQYTAVKQADLANGIAWVEPTRFSNTYAIAVSNENAQRLKLTKVSDIGPLLSSSPNDATLCAGGEFSTRPDALPGLEAAYGIKFAQDKVSNVQDALVYQQVDSGACVFGSIFSTDGRVASLGLTVLEDDKAFFPPFNGSLNVRKEVLDRYPKIGELFALIANDLDDKTMVGLNAEVDVDGKDPEDVARAWLEKNNYIAK